MLVVLVLRFSWTVQQDQIQLEQWWSRALCGSTLGDAGAVHDNDRGIGRGTREEAIGEQHR